MQGRLFSVLIATSLLAGCAMGPQHPEPAKAPEAVIISTTKTPPPPLADPIPPSRGPQYAWQAGYWRWEGDEFLWIPGRYAMRPEGAQWVQPRWAPVLGKWEFHEGSWQ